MQFSKHIRSLFQIRRANRGLAFTVTGARRPRVAVTALFCLAVVLIVGVLCAAELIHRHHRRFGTVGPNAELAAGPQAELPAPPARLSRRRKGFDAAIAVLRSAADQNQHLAGYYKGVVKRTGRQAVEAEAATSTQQSGNNQKPRSSMELSGKATAADLGQNRSEADGASIVQSRAATAGTSGDCAAGTNRDDATAGSDTVADQRQAEGLPSRPASSNSPAGRGGERSSLVAGDVKFDLNPAIGHWVQYYTGSRVGRSTMQQGLERCGAYLDASRAEFKQSGLPEDLVWVAQVESVWKQGAKSPVAAGGIWQFMPSTAADYGLAVGNPEDERFDPSKETRAAATYLHDLYTLFGSWELALAAYNCGEPRLMNAIVQCGQPDFWALYDRRLLPKETSNYVPKILAAIKVASDPDNYAFSIEARSN